jgi:hypothetical protein
MRIWNRFQWQNATKSMKFHFHRSLKRMADQLRNYHRDEKLPNLPAKLVTDLEEAREEAKAQAAAAIKANLANGYLTLLAPQEEERMDVNMSHPPPAAAAPAACAAAAPTAIAAAASAAKAATTVSNDSRNGNTSHACPRGRTRTKPNYTIPRARTAGIRGRRLTLRKQRVP